MAANILKLQDQLKGLPDKTLIQYAQSPNGQVPQYLVLGELQRRKTMRDEYQQGQNQAPKSTVAQDLEQGIGQLQQQPTQQAPQEAPMEEPQMAAGGVASLNVPENMFTEEYAGGGIVAFDEGGHVPGFAKGAFITNAPDIRAIDAQMRDISSQLRQLGGFFGLSQQTPEQQRQYEALQNKLQELTAQRALLVKSNQPETITSPLGRSLFGAPEKPSPDFETVGKMVSDLPSAANKTTPNAGPGITQPQIPSVQAPAVGKSPILPEAPEFKPDLLETEGARKALMQAQERYSPEAIAARRQSEREAAGIKDVYAQQMADLQAEKEKMSGDKSNAGWMSALEAGLAIAGGSSPFALQNLGVGALKGVSSYKDALKEIKQNEKELRREGNSLARAQQDSLEARLRGDQEAVERGQDRIIQAQSRYEDKADKNAMLTNSAMQFNIGKQFDRNLAIYSAETADKRLSRQLAAEASKFNAQMKMYQARIDASDRNTAARLQANRTAALANMYKDPDYQNFLMQLDERYKSKQGSANPSYQFEKQHYINQYLSTALGLTMEGGSARSAESLLED